MSRETISTDNAPAAIGTYSQAIKVDNTVYLSGQIPLVPSSMELVSEDIEKQVRQVFENLQDAFWFLVLQVWKYLQGVWGQTAPSVAQTKHSFGGRA